GDRIGMIKFGSRVELYLPTEYLALIQPGDIVRAGITPVARNSNVD
ncbi:MAG: phosphatidylserine decarboxylase, partial [Anaerolineales bacterium]|nr:phosphatidylserine decarboxylase [Anaerolineales bacterium]